MAIGAVSAQAQLVLTQTYSTPHLVDSESVPILFDFSSNFVQPGAPIYRTTLSIEFSKTPSLSDDPPFYSEMGFVLRKLSSSFTILDQITLINTGSFNDGAPGSFFSGTITFDDQALSLVNANPDQPSPGIFQPVEPLSTFNGAYSPFWELLIDDASAQNPLLFRSATLTVFAAVPESSTMTLAGAGLLGVIVFLRRQRLRRAARLPSDTNC